MYCLGALAFWEYEEVGRGLHSVFIHFQSLLTLVDYCFRATEMFNIRILVMLNLLFNGLVDFYCNKHSFLLLLVHVCVVSRSARALSRKQRLRSFSWRSPGGHFGPPLQDAGGDWRDLLLLSDGKPLFSDHA